MRPNPLKTFSVSSTQGLKNFVFFIKRLSQQSEDKRVINAINIEKDTGKVFVADSIDFESMKVRIERKSILT